METSIYLPCVNNTRIKLYKRIRLYEHEVLRRLLAHGIDGCSATTMRFRSVVMLLRTLIGMADDFSLKMQAPHVEFALSSWLDCWLQTVGEKNGYLISDLDSLLDMQVKEVRYRLDLPADEFSLPKEVTEQLPEEV